MSPDPILPISTHRTVRVRRAALMAACAALLGLSLVGTGCQTDFESRLAQIRVLQDAGEFNSSIEPLRVLLHTEPKHPEANYRLGIALMRTGRQSLAVWPLQKASQSEQFGVQAGIVLASVLYSSGDFEEAVRAADAVLAIDPERTQALYVRAQANIGAGRPEESLVDADHLLEVNPEDIQGALVRMAALIDLKRLDDAEQAHIRLKELAQGAVNPEVGARTCGLLANFYREHDRAEEAEAEYEGCLEGYPTNALLMEWASEFYIRQERSERAVEIWQNAVEQLPEDFSLRKKLADLLQQVGRADEAETVLVEAAELFDTVTAWQAVSAFYKDRGEYTPAREAVEKARDRAPGDVAALHFALADLLILEGELDQAETIANEIDEPAYKNLLLANIMMERGDAQGALKIFESGLRLWPNNAGARYQAGRAAEQLGDLTRALAEYREAIRVDQTATDAALHVALIHYSLGEYSAAAQFAERHIRQRPYKSPEAHLVRARSLAVHGESEEAMRTLEDLRRRDPAAIVAFVELAAIRRQLSGPADAAEILIRSEFDLSQPEYISGLQALASDLVALDKSAEALQRVDAAIAVSPDSPELYELKSRVLLRTGQVAPARAQAERALELQADLAQALETLSIIEQREGNLDAAIDLALRAADADTDNANYSYTASQLLRLQGRDDEAIERLREAVARDPGNAPACNDLAFELANAGRDLYQALDLAERAVRIQRGPTTLDTLGWVQLKRGDADAAAASFQRALDLQPESASIQYHLGLALIAAGKSSEGADLLRKALESDGFTEADEARRELAKVGEN
jgi:tetratricopeptide (TPR) repeat protein